MPKLSEIAPGALDSWMRNLNVRLRAVWFYTYRKRTWAFEAQVDDAVTFDECVETARLRLNATHALYEQGDEWALVMGNRIRFYPNREAAEMVAIHEEAKA